MSTDGGRSSGGEQTPAQRGASTSLPSPLDLTSDPSDSALPPISARTHTRLRRSGDSSNSSPSPPSPHLSPVPTTTRRRVSPADQRLTGSAVMKERLLDDPRHASDSDLPPPLLASSPSSSPPPTLFSPSGRRIDIAPTPINRPASLNTSPVQPPATPLSPAATPSFSAVVASARLAAPPPRRDIIDPLPPMSPRRPVQSATQERTATAFVMSHQSEATQASLGTSNGLQGKTGHERKRSASRSQGMGGEEGEEDGGEMRLRRCCGLNVDWGRAWREAWAYVKSFDPFVIFLVFLAIVVAVILYVFDCRGAEGSSANCAAGPMGNPWWVWFAAFALIIVSWEVAYLAERLVLFVFSLSIGTVFWRVYFYVSCVDGTGRWLGWFSCLLAFRQQYSGFQLDSNWSSVIDPGLVICVLALSLEILRKVLLKHFSWKINERAFEPKLQQLYFIVDFIARLAQLEAIQNVDVDMDHKASDEVLSPSARAALPSQSSFPLPHLNAGGLFSNLKLWTINQAEAREALRSVRVAKMAAVALWRNLEDFEGSAGLAQFKAFLPLQAACRAMYLCLPQSKKAIIDGDAKDDGDALNPLSGVKSNEGEQRTKLNPFLRPETHKKPRTRFNPAAFEGIMLRRHDFVDAMAAFAAERKQLSLELTDWHSFSSVLNSVSLIMYGMVVIFVLIAVYANGTSITSALVPLTSFFLSFSFIFGNTLKSVLESLLFIASNKPYSTGDRIELRNHPEGELEVYSIALLTTTFKDTNNKVTPHSPFSLSPSP